MSRPTIPAAILLGCGSLGALFAQVSCSSDEPSGTADAGPSTTTDASTTPPGPDAPVTTCPDLPARAKTNQQCSAELGGPAVYVDATGACAAVTTELCPNLLGSIDSDDTLLLGAVLSITGVNATAGIPRENAIRIAVEEINAAGGILSGDPCKPARPLAIVSCDEGATNGARLGATYLSETLKVPAIIGANTSQATIDMANDVTIPNKTLIMSMAAVAPELATLEGATVDGVRIVWRTAVSDAVQTQGTKLMLAEAAQQLSDSGVNPLKVALLNRNDAYGKAAAELMKKTVFNGAPLDDPANAANALFFEYDAKNQEAGKQFADAIAALEPFAPHLIIPVGFGEMGSDIIGGYEATNPAPKPLYWGPHGFRRTELTTLVTGNDDLRQRIRGTLPGIITPLAQNFFFATYKVRYPESSGLIQGQAASYDAAYLLAYAAMAAQREGGIDSLSLGRGLGQLIEGTEHNVGTATYNSVAQTLLTGGSVNITGISGPLDFDTATGEAPSDIAVWCISVNPNDSTAVFSDSTGQFYDYRANALSGTFVCPN